MLGQHHLLPLATYVEAGTLGGVIAELLPPTWSYEHLHARRKWRQSHIPFGLYGVYPFSRRTRTEEMAEYSMTRTAGGIRALYTVESERATYGRV